MNEFDKVLDMLQARAKRHETLAGELFTWAARPDITKESADNFAYIANQHISFMNEVYAIIHEVKELQKSEYIYNLRLERE